MKKTLRQTFIGDRAFYAMVLAVAVPIMLENGITNFVNMLDNIMIGRVGTAQMSGVAIVNQLIYVFYLCLFGGESWKGLKGWHWLVAGLVAGFIVAALVTAIGITGALLAPMSIYAMGLMLLIFSGLMGVIRIGGLTWWLILCGGILFTFSDAQIAMQTFDVLPFALRGFVIMLTYLAAQVLLAIGGIRLILKK